MKKIVCFIVFSVFSLHALADWDYELEAKEAAEKKALEEQQAKENAKADVMRKDAEAKANAKMQQQNKKTMASKRKALGKAANGKSDAEVEKLYDAKVQKDMAEAQKAANTPNPEKEAQMKKMYGKDTKDLMNMSDEELEAFSKDMEKKYNQ